MQSHQLATPHWNLLLNGRSPKSQCSLTSLLDIASIKQNHIDGRLWKLPTGHPMHFWCWLHTHPYFPPVNCTLQRHGLFRRQFLQRILTFDSFTWVGSWPKQMCIVTFLPSAKKTVKKRWKPKVTKVWQYCNSTIDHALNVASLSWEECLHLDFVKDLKS